MKSLAQFAMVGLGFALGCGVAAAAYLTGREVGRDQLSVVRAETELIRQSVGMVVPVDGDAITTTHIAAFDREVWALVSAGQELEALREAYATALEQLDTLSEQSVDSSQVEALQSRVTELESALQDREAEIQRLSGLEGASTQLSSTRAELARTRSLADNRNATITSLQRQLSAANAQLADAQDRLSALAGNAETVTLRTNEIYSDPARGIEFVVLGHDHRGTLLRHSGRSHRISLTDRVSVSRNCSITYIARPRQNNVTRYQFRFDCPV